MRCSSCGNDDREGRKFCAQCGQPVKLACPSCDAPNEPQAGFCGDWGAALVVRAGRRDSTARHNFDRPDVGTKARIAAAKAESQLTLEGERKTVTALFADI
jgi:hypothetical protein